jgi:hypothetical protein
MICYGIIIMTGRWPPLPDKFTMVACVCVRMCVPRKQKKLVVFLSSREQRVKQKRGFSLRTTRRLKHNLVNSGEHPRNQELVKKV